MEVNSFDDFSDEKSEFPENELFTKLLLSLKHDCSKLTIQQEAENLIISKLLKATEFFTFSKAEWITVREICEDSFKFTRKGEVDFHKGHSAYHKSFYEHVASKEYQVRCHALHAYGPNENLMSLLGFYLTKIRFEVLKHCQPLNEDEDAESVHRNTEEIVSSEHAKLRYLFGRCFAKENFSYRSVKFEELEL